MEAAVGSWYDGDRRVGMGDLPTLLLMALWARNARTPGRNTSPHATSAAQRRGQPCSPTGLYTQSGHVLTNLNPHVRQRRQVRRVERVKLLRAGLDGAVPAQELVVEEQTHLGDRVVACDDEGAEKVVDRVVEEFRERNLRPGQDDRFATDRKQERVSRVRRRVASPRAKAAYPRSSRRKERAEAL